MLEYILANPIGKVYAAKSKPSAKDIRTAQRTSSEESLGTVIGVWDEVWYETANTGRALTTYQPGHGLSLVADAWARDLLEELKMVKVLRKANAIRKIKQQPFFGETKDGNDTHRDRITVRNRSALMERDRRQG